MKFSVPWSVKGIQPEARETAREAARRSGLSLSDWLNTVIMQQAAQAGLGQPQAPHHYADDQAYGAELAGVHQRLDDLTRRIENFTRTGPATYAPKRQHDETQTADLIGRLDRRLDQMAGQPMAAAPLAPTMPGMPNMPASPPRPNIQLPPALDRAMAEIAARQRMLNGGAAPAHPAQRGAQQQLQQQPASAMPPRATVPTQDISGLEQQLRKITAQIETLRKPGVEEAINALRAELGDIAHALDDAMPKRAIDTIEQQIAGLSQRVAESRQAGIDVNALSGIEHGMAEVRDALRGLTPAEHLVGFNEAVDGLAQKIDLIIAQKDPATLQQLEDAITTLRGMASSVASNEAVSRLAIEVEALTDKVDHLARGPVGEVLSSLENRIDALSQALTERARNGNSVPPRLEALVESLAEKIEQIQHNQQFQQLQQTQSPGDGIAVSHMEDRIVELVARLDASDSRFGHLEAIERGLADLLVHLEEMRADRQEPRGGDPAVVDALKHDVVRSQDAFRQDIARTQDAFRQYIVRNQDAFRQDIARTQDAIDAVHGTLGIVVDRLALIEKDIRAERQAPPATAAYPAPSAAPAHAAAEDDEPLELTHPVSKLSVRLVDDRAEPAQGPATAKSAPAPDLLQPAQSAPQPQAKSAAKPQAEPAAADPRLPSAAQLPINPDLPGDQPLEPGSRPPARPHPSVRIAASEAALGNTGPVPPADVTTQSNFIAAARRAAKAAVQERAPAAPRGAEQVEPDAEGEGRLSTRAKMLKRVKLLLIAASIVALVVGLAQVGGKIPFGHSSSIKTAHRLDTKPAKKPTAAKVAAAPHELLAPTTAKMLMGPAAIISLPVASSPAVRHAPDLLNPPALYGPGDITGSIPDAARHRHTSPTPSAAPETDAEHLPVAIGGAHLRKAAVAGDVGAAYEVAVRYAEGRGVTANLHEAARWYERAAGKGLAAAQFRLASMLEKGQGVKKNLVRARRLYLAAAGQGNAKAMHNLAVLYAEGIDGKPDYATAVNWFQKAARHGVADSQYNLGVLYARGIGVEKNLIESYKWFALAAAHGDKESAKKRDDVASRLEAKKLAAARHAVASFKAEPQPAIATAVPTPPGGWDKGTPAKAPSNPNWPLSLGSFTVGAR